MYLLIKRFVPFSWYSVATVYSSYPLTTTSYYIRYIEYILQRHSC